MSILVIEERRYPSAKDKDINDTVYLKPIIECIKKIKDNCFEFEYAIENTSVKKDTDEYLTFEDDIDDDKLLELIDRYNHIILLGSHLCEKILDKSLAKLDREVKVGNKYFYPNYSSFYCYKNKKSLLSTFKLAHIRFRDNILIKDKPKYKILNTLESLQELKRCNEITNIFSFDFETTGLDYYNDAKATILSICFQPGFSYIIPIEHHEHTWDDLDLVLEVLQELFKSDSIKVAHNLKFDLHILTKYNIALKPRTVDTMLMSHVLNEHRRHGLKELTKEYFPFWSDYEDSVDFLGPLDQLSEYAAIDTDITIRLFYIFENELLENGNYELYRLFRNLVMPAVSVFQDIEYRGCKLDRDLILTSIDEANRLLKIKLSQLNEYVEIKRYIRYKDEQLREIKRKELVEKITLRENEQKFDRYYHNYREQLLDLYSKVFFEEVNYNSHVQLNEVLYDFFKFDEPIIDGSKKRTTERDYIKDFNHPFINTLSAYRTISKMISTYYEGLLNRMSVDDRIHGSFLLHGTVTGRISSRDPNLQNIPGRITFDDKEAEWCIKQVKKFFKPTNNYIVQADYSQAELRLMANFSKDSIMIDSYIRGLDLHTITGQLLTKLTPEEWESKDKEYQKKWRTVAKGANFSLIYGVSVDGYIDFVKAMSGVVLTRLEAENHRNDFFKKYKSIIKYHENCKNQAEDFGYVSTLFGRRRRLLNINNLTNMALVNKDIRDSINSPIQGTGGELTIFCIVLLYHRLDSNSKIWSTIHDSILFDVQDLSCTKIIIDTCSNPPIYEYFKVRPSEFPVQMKMDFEYSEKSWGDLVELGDEPQH